MNHETDEVFEKLGYTAMAKRQGISLVDLNYGPVKILENPDCPVFPKMYLPEIAFSHYIISVPVLKAHSLAGMTGSLKKVTATSIFIYVPEKLSHYIHLLSHLISY